MSNKTVILEIIQSQANEREAPQDSVSVESLGLDTFDLVEIIVSVEKRFSIEIKMEDLDSYDKFLDWDVGDFVKWLLARVEG